MSTSPVCVKLPPVEAALPIVIDSPHSGRFYPADFGYSVPFELLRMGEDLFIDDLYADAPAAGATFIAANFPRAYIDPNRTLADLDTSMLDGPWPDPVQPGPKTTLGIGLIWKLMRGDVPMYQRQLSVAEVRQRIDTWYRPYHQALDDAIAAAHQRHGTYWHLNVHSMPDDSYVRLKMPDKPLADFVLGDLDGSTFSEPALQAIENSLRASGYTTARNDPFKGVDIVRRHGQPAQKRFSLQVEIKRSCYADVVGHAKGANFAQAQTAINAMLGALAAHVKTQL